MAGFMYFRSGSTKPIDADGVRSLGLGHILEDDASIESRATNAGSPSGKPGLVFADPNRQAKDRPIGIHLDGQTWRQLPEVDDRPELWIGYWNDAKPGPGDLARAVMLRGPSMTMGDDNAWQIPIVRNYDQGAEKWESQLPAHLDYDKQGNIVRGKPLARYAELWELTAPLAGDRFERGDEAELDEQSLYRAVVALLQANYVVDLPEIAVLGVLVDDDSLVTVSMVACQYDRLMEWIDTTQKKSESQQDESGLNSSDGEAA